MSSENTATATALSFLSLPPELRVQIYRCLLCRSSWIQLQRHKPPKYWSTISHKALSGSEPEADRDLSPEIAILRTCRTIYSEAIPILYGENTFTYLCWTTALRNSDYPVTAFLDMNLKRIKHLELDVEAECRDVQVTTASVVATIRHFTERGCDLRTFELALNGIWTDERCLLAEVTASQKIMTALVELKVSKSLTISGWYDQQGPGFDERRKSLLDDDFRKFVNRLASEKAMAATKQESTFVSEYTAENGTEDDSEGGDDDDGDKDGFLPSYKLSWCLHPQRSEEQSAKTASSVD